MWLVCKDCAMLFVIYEVEGNEKKDECPRCHRKLDISNTEEVEGKKTNSY